MIMSLACCFAACDEELKTEKNNKLPESVSFEGDVGEGLNQEQIVTKVIEFDLDLKSDLKIEADVVEFADDILIYTNGHRLELEASKIILKNTRILGFRNFSSGCNQNGKAPKDVYFNTDQIEGSVFFDLKGTNAGKHCKTHFGIVYDGRWCADNFGSSKKCLAHFRKIAPFNGGSSGRVIYNNSSDIEKLNLDFNEETAIGSPRTRMRYNHTINRTVPKGKSGARMKICVNFNKVVMCD